MTTKIVYKIFAVVLIIAAITMVFNDSFKPFSLLEKINPTDSAKTIIPPSSTPEIVKPTKLFLRNGQMDPRIMVKRYKQSQIFCFKAKKDLLKECAIVFDQEKPLPGIVVPRLKAASYNKLESKLKSIKEFYEQQHKKGR